MVFLFFPAEEILDFSQQDLVPNDVMVLDIGTAIFIWQGQGANKTERVEAPKLVEEYLKTGGWIFYKNKNLIDEEYMKSKMSCRTSST